MEWWNSWGQFGFVKRSQYYELYKVIEEKNEDGDDFYLPDVKHDAMEYYIRTS